MERVARHAALLLFFVSVTCLDLTKIVPFAERIQNPRSKWSPTRPAHPSDVISFKVLLKVRNVDKLNSIFNEVSDPTHANYGKFLSTSQVNTLISPSTASVNKVLEWLLDSVSEDSLVSYPGYIHVTTSVGRASNLFTALFYRYESNGMRPLVRIYGPAHMPSELRDEVDFVVGISELFDFHAGPVRHAALAEDSPIIPSVLKTYYQIPTTPATNKKNSQAVVAFGQFFSLGALAAFDKFLGLISPNISRQGTNCFPDCPQTESDADVQYITAIGTGVPTVFMGYEQGDWILDWALAANTLSKPPLVSSISYGWAELDQCEITDNCEKLGYTSLQYVNRTDIEYQALGVKGVSIIVASGDDGAPSLAAASGNCPMDPTKYCPGGGCHHTTSNCTEITSTKVSNNTECFFPMGLGNDICAEMVDDPNWEPALQEWIKANNACNIAIESDSQYEPHLYSACPCTELKVVTSNGYRISSYTFNQTKGSVFSANYPASSPYVTAVGATQFTWNKTGITSEISASVQTGAFITTSGGFSSFLAQPSYQTAAVANYIKTSSANLPPSFSFNAKMRAYPDVAFSGHNFIMFESNNSANYDICPCQQYLADGTGCSSPSFAGMVSLINDKLLTAGKSPLGFLNPLLYQMAAAKPAAFHDIISGTNKCNRVYCCLYGYSATPGWDPVTGLGSPNFPDFEAYILSVKNITNS